MSPPSILTSVDQPEYNLILINLLIIKVSPLSRRFFVHVVSCSNNFINRICLLKLTASQPGKDVQVLYETQRFIKPTVSTCGRDNVIGTATRSRAGRWVQAPHTRPVRPPSPRSLPHNGHRVPFPEVKRPGRCTDHPPPSSAGVGYGYSCNYTSPVCLLGM